MGKHRPYRRKRRQIMRELAHQKAFCVAKRLNAREVAALETIAELIDAFGVAANREITDVAVMMRLDSSRNPARDVIARLERKGLVAFRRTEGGLCPELPDWVEAAFDELERFEEMIEQVLHSERDGAPDQAAEAARAELVERGIYIGMSDAELAARMRTEVTKEVEMFRLANGRLPARTAAAKVTPGFRPEGELH